MSELLKGRRVFHKLKGFFQDSVQLSRDTNILWYDHSVNHN